MTRLPPVLHLLAACVGLLGVITLRQDGGTWLLAAGLFVVEGHHWLYQDHVIKREDDT